MVQLKVQSGSEATKFGMGFSTRIVRTGTSRKIAELGFAIRKLCVHEIGSTYDTHKTYVYSRRRNIEIMAKWFMEGVTRQHVFPNSQ